jgi:hypothetical protein
MLLPSLVNMHSTHATYGDLDIDIFSLATYVNWWGNCIAIVATS